MRSKASVSISVIGASPSSPWRVPGGAHRLVHGFCRLPEGEVSDILLLVLVVRHSGTRARVVGVQPLEAAISGERTNREINRPVLHRIGEFLLFELFDPRHHLGYVAGSQGIGSGRKNPKGSRVGQDRLGERRRVCPHVFPYLGRTIDGLVVHIGEVHDEVDLVAGPRQIAVE